MLASVGRFADWLLGVDAGSDSDDERVEIRSSTAWISPSTLSPRTSASSSPYAPVQSDLGNLELVAIYRAVSMLSDLVATLPFEAQRLDPVDATVPRRDRTWTVLDRQPTIIGQPDPLEAQDQTLRRISSNLALRGEAFVVVTMRDPDTGRPLSAIVPENDDVTIAWNRNRTRRLYRWRGDELDSRNVAHIGYLWVPNLLHALGPLQAAGRFIGGALAADEFARRLFADGRLPGGVIESPVMLSDEEAAALKAQWMSANAPLSREPGVLSGGATYSQTNVRPDEAQFIETRGFGVEQVAAMFGLDPYLLAHQVPGSSLVYRNVAGLFQSLLRTTLEPQYLSKIENVFSAFLPEGQRARFNTNEFLRSDTMERMQAYEVAIRSQVMTPNEARRAEGLPPIAGGDELATSQTAPEVQLPTDEAV